MIRTAIIGLGAISIAHISAISKCRQVELVAVCDVNSEKRSVLPHIPFYEDFEEMFAEEELDAVHICLPHHLHTMVSRKAAENKIHIFVEKPIGIGFQDFESMLFLEETYGVCVGVCLQNRYNKTSQRIKKIIESKEYGDLKGIKAILAWNRGMDYYFKDPWRGAVSGAGSGLLLSQAIHTIDLLAFLAGEVEWVKGATGNLLLEEIEVEDTAMAYIKHLNGVGSVFFGTVIHCINSNVEMEFVFENNVVYMNDDQLFLINEGERKILAKNHKISEGKKYYGAGHTLAIKQFYSSINNDKQDYISVQDAYECIKIIDGILKSDKKNEKIFL